MIALTPECKLYIEAVMTSYRQGRTPASSVKMAGDVPEETLGQVILALGVLGDQLERLTEILADTGNPVQAYQHPKLEHKP